MKIEGVVALVTGANGGIGKALVAELLARGASKVYIGGRSNAALSDLLAAKDSRLVPVILDVTNDAQVNEASKHLTDVTLVINNAGYCAVRGTLAADAMQEAQREMDVNYFGPLRVARAFEPVLTGAGGGTIVNILSFLSLVTLPLMGTYSASKGAALAMTRSLRAELAMRNIDVLAAMPVQIDTAMGDWYDGPKVSREEAVADILNAVEAAAVEVFPGKLSQDSAAAFETNPKILQAQLATVLPAA